MLQLSAMFYTGKNLLECTLPGLIHSHRSVVQSSWICLNVLMIYVCITDIVNLSSITGCNRNTICSIASNSIYYHYIPCNRVLLVSVQGPLVLVCIVLYISLFCISWDAYSFLELKYGDSLSIGHCCLHHIESFLRVPHAWTGKPFYLPISSYILLWQ